MKIKEFKLLREYYKSGWYGGMDRIGAISWKEIILEDINGNQLELKIKEKSEGSGQKLSSKRFIKENYNKLSEKKKEQICKIFKTNIGKSIAEILELDF